MKAMTNQKKGGSAVFAVEQKAPDRSVELFATKEDIKWVAGQTIEKQYTLAYSAPIISHNMLLHDIGFTGDGKAVQAILDGTYKFPRDKDPWTWLLITEAVVLFSSLGQDDIVDLVNRQDFQKWWHQVLQIVPSLQALQSRCKQLYDFTTPHHQPQHHMQNWRCSRPMTPIHHCTPRKGV